MTNHVKLPIPYRWWYNWRRCWLIFGEQTYHSKISTTEFSSNSFQILKFSMSCLFVGKWRPKKWVQQSYSDSGKNVGVVCFGISHFAEQHLHLQLLYTEYFTNGRWICEVNYTLLCILFHYSRSIQSFLFTVDCKNGSTKWTMSNSSKNYLLCCSQYFVISTWTPLVTGIVSLLKQQSFFSSVISLCSPVNRFEILSKILEVFSRKKKSIVNLWSKLSGMPAYNLMNKLHFSSGQRISIFCGLLNLNLCLFSFE